MKREPTAEEREKIGSATGSAGRLFGERVDRWCTLFGCTGAVISVPTPSVARAQDRI
jgi:hypothetical protein